MPDFSYPADPSAGGVAAYWDGHWTAFGGTSVAAPTNAGLFVDTNQGCFSQLGRVGPALYAAQQANGGSFTDITQGNNDFTDTNLGHFAAATGFDAASGLGTPVDQNLSLALQGADGCPSVAAVSPNTGPVSGGGAITIDGGGFGNATSVTFGAVGRRAHCGAVGHLHHRRPAQRVGRPVRRRHGRATRRASPRSPPPTTTASAGTSTAARATASSRPTGASSTSGTPASRAARAACR